MVRAIVPSKLVTEVLIQVPSEPIPVGHREGEQK
jgi:hypothetical protein